MYIPKKAKYRILYSKRIILKSKFSSPETVERKLIDGHLHFSRKCHCLLIQWNWQITLTNSWNFKRVTDKFIELNSFAISR